MKNIQRKIGPKFGERNNLIINNEFKPRLYEDQINFDRMRMYRLNRVKEELLKNDIGACIITEPLYDPSGLKMRS